MIESLSSRIEYFSKLANPYFIIPAWLCWFAAFVATWSLFFHSVFIGPTPVFAGSDGPVISRIGLLAMSVSILSILPQARGFFVNAFIVVFENNQLIGIKMFGVPAYDKLAREPMKTVSSRWLIKVPLNEITAVKAMPYLGVTSVQIFIILNGREIKILEISSGLKGIGELLEKTLPLMDNLRFVEFKKFTETRYWGKEPDWTIIKDAQRRAEENRKKMENKKKNYEQQDTPPT